MPEPELQRIRPVLSSSEALEFIADAGAVLSSSLDYDRTLRQVAELAVPEVADWCGLLVVGPDGAEEEITAGHVAPELDALLREIRRRRRARDGASESRRVAASGESVLVHDVSQVVAPDLDEHERAMVVRLAPKSYMLVPLLARGRTLGSLTLLSTRESRHYTEQDLAFAETLAGRCALAIDNARLHELAERSLSLLDTFVATAPIGLAVVDLDLRFVHVNDRLAAISRRPIEEHLGRPVSEVLGHAEGLVALLRRVVTTAEPLLGVELSAPSAEHGGEVRHFDVSCSPVRGPHGDLLAVSAVVADVTERRRLLEAEREARRRADFLASAGALLDASLDYEETLTALTQIAVPDIADWCAVSVLDPSGALRQVAAAHVDPAQRAIGEELSRRFPPDPGAPGGTLHVARSGRTEVVTEVTDAMLAAGTRDPEQLALVRRLSLRSVIIAALRARGRTLGTLTLATARSERTFTAADVQLAEELARRAGIAIDNARLYTERSRIAHTLQAKLLPARLPDIPGVVLAARYRAAGELNEVGGDFYDVFARSEDEWAMVVGDVSGKGAEAAAITALARYTLRTAAMDDVQPARALQRLNGAMLVHDDAWQFVTAVLAYVAAVADDHVAVRLSLAGHPPSLVVRRDGTVESAGRFGTMLGVRVDPELHDCDVLLGPGDVLLLYTDGVTEAGSRSTPFGEHALVELLGRLAGRAPQDVVDAVEAAVVDAQDGQPRDDIALLALGLRHDAGR